VPDSEELSAASSTLKARLQSVNDVARRDAPANLACAATARFTRRV
jgi:hypothetical protein